MFKNMDYGGIDLLLYVQRIKKKKMSYTSILNFEIILMIKINTIIPGPVSILFKAGEKVPVKEKEKEVAQVGNHSLG